MSRLEMVHCDYVYPDGSGACGLSVPVRVATGWQLGGPDFCPRHRPTTGNGGGQPIPLRGAS